MIRIIDDSVWGTSIFEDTDTGEVSIQCLCGGIGMYWQRLVLTPEEARRAREGSLDVAQLVSDVCKDMDGVVERKVPAIDPGLLREEKIDGAHRTPMFGICAGYFHADTSGMVPEMASRRVLYKNEHHMFTVSTDRGRLVLEVLCGGPGMYPVEHWLTEQEVATFHTDPEALTDLARSLCD